MLAHFGRLLGRILCGIRMHRLDAHCHCSRCGSVHHQWGIGHDRKYVKTTEPDEWHYHTLTSTFVYDVYEVSYTCRRCGGSEKREETEPNYNHIPNSIT